MLYLGFEPRATGLEGADDSTELYRLQIFLDIKNWIISGAAIAQWIRLRLPSCHPGVKSQVHHLCFHQL